MVPSDDPGRLVARYLLDHGYLGALEVFLDEVGVGAGAMGLDGDVPVDDDGIPITLDNILSHRRKPPITTTTIHTDLDVVPVWNTNTAPASPTPLAPQAITANVLALTVAQVNGRPVVVVCTGDRCVRGFDMRDGRMVVDFGRPHGSGVVAVAVVGGGEFVVSGGMDGMVRCMSMVSGAVVGELRSHSRYAHRIAVHPTGHFLATAGYDKHVHVYRVSAAAPNPVFDHLGTIEVPTHPDAIAFVGQDLALTRKRSNYIHRYTLPTLHPHTDNPHNLNANGDDWVSFDAADLTVSEVGGRVLMGVSAGTSPGGRFLVVDGRVPVPEGDELEDRFAQLGRSRGEGKLRQTIRHDALQTPLGVPPIHVWRPDGSGVWCNSDDGRIFGLALRRSDVDEAEMATAGRSSMREGEGEGLGGVVAVLQGAHANAVRTLWSGMVAVGENGEEEEVMVSGGFDRKVFVWRCEK
ncbi:hypothetical protein PYCC9005_001581 [Savitreella phatthalungensis]